MTSSLTHGMTPPTPCKKCELRAKTGTVAISRGKCCETEILQPICFFFLLPVVKDEVRGQVVCLLRELCYKDPQTAPGQMIHPQVRELF